MVTRVMTGRVEEPPDHGDRGDVGVPLGNNNVYPTPNNDNLAVCKT